jgi:tetratricopeptide (TPR) repeat protein
MSARLFTVRAVGVILAATAIRGTAVPRELPAAERGLAFQESAPKQTGASTQSNAQAWFAKGQAALQTGDLDAAEDAFRKVIAADPRAGAAYSNLGVIAMRRKDWVRAMAMLHKAEKLAPMEAGIRLNIGLVEYRRGNYAAAITPLSSVVRDLPDSQQARYLLGLSNFFTERYSEAVKILEPLWSQMSHDVVYLYVLDIAAHSAGINEVEEKALARMIEVGGAAPEFHLILAKAYLYRRQFNEALSELNLASNANPNLPFVHLNLGIVYMRLNQNERAEEELLKGVAIEPDLADNYEQLGILSLRLQREADAERYLKEAIQRDSRMPTSHFVLAKIYLQQQKFQQALGAVDSALRLAPDSQSVHYLRGRVLMRLGRREEADAEFSAAQKILGAVLEKEVGDVGEDRIPNPEIVKQPQQ